MVWPWSLRTGIRRPCKGQIAESRFALCEEIMIFGVSPVRLESFYWGWSSARRLDPVQLQLSVMEIIGVHSGLVHLVFLIAGVWKAMVMETSAPVLSPGKSQDGVCGQTITSSGETAQAAQGSWPCGLNAPGFRRLVLMQYRIGASTTCTCITLGGAFFPSL